MRRSAFLIVLSCLAALAHRSLAVEGPTAPGAPATITSDELELRENGAVTVFRGHVVLISEPYRLTADKMTRWRDRDVVEAHGRVVGTWIQPTGEKIVATGASARYRPGDQITELWGKPKVTRWETVRDTAPVVVTAERFVANQKDGTIDAHSNVVAVQGEQMSVRSDEAKFIQSQKVIHLWGLNRVKVHWRDAKGVADFEGDKGFVWLDPRRARMVDKVQGHVVPSSL